MTLRLYGHLFEGTQVQLSEKIDELRAATEPKDGAVVPFHSNWIKQEAVTRQLGKKKPPPCDKRINCPFPSLDTVISKLANLAIWM